MVFESYLEIQFYPNNLKIAKTGISIDRIIEQNQARKIFNLNFQIL